MNVFKQLSTLLWWALCASYVHSMENDTKQQHTVTVADIPPSSRTVWHGIGDDPRAVGSSSGASTPAETVLSSRSKNIHHKYGDGAEQSIGCCGARVSCCGKVMRCGGFTLCSMLVATTTLIGLYLSQLATTCSQLLPPINEIDQSIKKALVFGQEKADFANETAVQLHQDLLDVSTQARLAQATVNGTCQRAQNSCDAATQAYKSMENRCGRCP